VPQGARAPHGVRAAPGRQGPHPLRAAPPRRPFTGLRHASEPHRPFPIPHRAPRRSLAAARSVPPRERLEPAGPRTPQAKPQQQPQQQRPVAQAAQQQHPQQQAAMQQQPQSQQPVPPGGAAYASTHDFSSKVEIYRGRHSVVWNVVCRATRRPLILKGYMKVRRRADCGGGRRLCTGPDSASPRLAPSPLALARPPPPHQAKMTERNFHQVRREIKLMQQIVYDGAVKLHGTFEDSAAIYLVQEICAKVGLRSARQQGGGPAGAGRGCCRAAAVCAGWPAVAACARPRSS
jgi:hypothetical protein